MDRVGTLSARELDVLRLVAEGLSNTAIGERLYVSPRTVEAHVRAVYDKLDLPAALDGGRRVCAVLWYLRRQDELVAA